MLKISRAALLAAMLSLSGTPAIGLVGAMAQDTTSSVSGVNTSLSIPTIIAVDSTMDETALRDALSGGFAKHASELAGLSATSITIPEITLTVTVTSAASPTTSTVRYKDIVLNSVKNGVAASVSVGSSETESAEGSFKFGKLSTSTLDIGAILALYSVVPASGDASAMKTLYKDFSFEGGTLTGPKVQCTFGKITAAEFDARPLKVSFAELMQATQQMEAAHGDPSPESMATLIGFLTDIFQAFKSEPINMDGLNCSGTAEDGNPFTLGIGGVEMGGYAPGIYPAITVRDLKIGDGGANSVSLAEASLKAIDLSAPIAVVEAEKANITPVWLQTNARLLIPSFGGFSLSGLAVDVPNPDKPDERIKANIESFDLTLGNYVNGVPSKISTSASGVDVPLPADDPQTAMFQAMGITHVNLGYDLSATWDKASQSIIVDKLAVSGKDLGSLAFAATVGNATEALFDLNPQTEMMAGMGVTVKNITIDISDGGLGEIVAPLAAGEQKVDPATFRTQMGAALEGMAIQMLGSTDGARSLGAAVSDFVGGKKKALTINLAAKSAAGVPLMQLMAVTQQAQDPMQLGPILTGLLDITGSAN